MIDRGSMAETDFMDSVRAIATGLQTLVESKGIEGDDVTAMVSSALLEVLGQRLGVFGAVERLRMLADIAERQALSDARH